MLTFIKNLLWTVPFFCFIGGYLLLDTIYHQEDIQTPALVGKDIHEAFTLLSHHNLNARLITFKEDGMLEQGTIISQTPAPTQKIKPNQSVFLVVSCKPQRIKAPTLLGKTGTEIEQELQKDKLHVKTYHVESTYPKDQCFCQKPAPGEYLDGTTMLAYISAGLPRTVIVPDVKNKPVELVKDFLKTQTVTVEIVHHPALQDLEHQCTNCIVIDQRPYAGTIVTLHEEKPLHMQLQTSMCSS